jgi:hypothetical protein
MPRFFFNFHIVDEEGVELTGPDEARSQAIATAGEMLRDKGAGASGPEQSGTCR